MTTAMINKDAMIEAVARLSMESHICGLTLNGEHVLCCDPRLKNERGAYGEELWVRPECCDCLTAGKRICEFMQAREQAAREEGRKQERGEIVEWLRQDAKKLTAEQEASNPYTATWLSLREQIESADVYADMIESGEHREQQDG